MKAMLQVASSAIGRRRKINQAEMSACLQAMADAGLDLGNDCVMDASPEKWARMCHGLTCVSVLADGAAPHGQVRYDDPGSMHPMHYAAVMFAPAALADDEEHDPVGYLRRHCKRLVLVNEGGLPEPPAPVKPEDEVYDFFCDNGHKWQATKAEDEAADHRCPVCGEYWV